MAWAHAADSQDAWWTHFRDPLLTSAIEAAMANNPDLAAAEFRRKQAVAGVFQQASGSLPQVSLAASSNWSPTESLGFGFGVDLSGAGGDPSGDDDTPKSYSTGQAQLQATWNVDLFGQNGSLVHAADREAKAALSDLMAQELSIASRVSEAYWDAVVAERFLSLAEEQLDAQASLLEALTLRYGDSDVGALDVLQQRQQVASAKVQIPQRRIQVRMAKQKLAVLLGQTPDSDVTLAAELPPAPQPIDSANLNAAIEHRPDLVASYRRLQAAKSRHWSAWASALPQVGVSAQTGMQFFDQEEWTSQKTWGVGTSVTMPLFSGGRSYGSIRRARLGVREAEARLQGARLNAAQQAQTAWARDVEQQSLLDALAEQHEAADQAWLLAREQVVQGVAPYLNAQAALSRKQQAELSLLQGHREALSARIALIQSLGGISPQEETP